MSGAVAMIRHVLVTPSYSEWLVSGEKRMTRGKERKCGLNKWPKSSVPNDDLRTDWLIL